MQTRYTLLVIYRKTSNVYLVCIIASMSMSKIGRTNEVPKARGFIARTCARENTYFLVYLKFFALFA